MPNKKARRNNNRKEKKPAPPPKLFTMKDKVERRMCMPGISRNGVNKSVDTIMRFPDKENNIIVIWQLKLNNGELQWVKEIKPYYL